MRLDRPFLAVSSDGSGSESRHDTATSSSWPSVSVRPVREPTATPPSLPCPPPSPRPMAYQAE